MTGATVEAIAAHFVTNGVQVALRVSPEDGAPIECSVLVVQRRGIWSARAPIPSVGTWEDATVRAVAEEAASDLADWDIVPRSPALG